MNTISFDVGIKEFNINGAVSVFFNPTDMRFIECVFDVFEKLDNMQNEYVKKIESLNSDNTELFNITREMDREMRETINLLFNLDICHDIFGEMYVYAIADGLPVWANLMLALIDQLDVAFVEERKRTNPRVQHYLNKYNRK